MNLPETFHTLTLFNDTTPLLSIFVCLGKVPFPVFDSLIIKLKKPNTLTVAKSSQSNTGTPLDQESKAIQCLKQPQEHFKRIDTFHNIILSSNFCLNLNFSLIQMHRPRISIQGEHLTNIQPFFFLFYSIVITVCYV